MAQCVSGEQYYEIDGQLAEIKRQLRQPSGYPFDPNLLKVALQEIVEGRLLGNRLTIDYSLSLAKMIALGRYGLVDSSITAKHFPIIGSGKAEVTIELMHFGCSIYSKDAISQMRLRKLRPANLAELLACGVAHPEEQRKFPIVALGAEALVDGLRRVACLCGHDLLRGLSLSDAGSSWAPYYRFLAVRK